MSNQTVPTVLAEFPKKPTKGQLLESLLKVADDLGLIYDSINEGPESMVLAENVATLLGLTCTRLNTLKAVLGTIAYIESMNSVHPRLIVP